MQSVYLCKRTLRDQDYLQYLFIQSLVVSALFKLTWIGKSYGEYFLHLGSQYVKLKNQFIGDVRDDYFKSDSDANT